MDSIGFHPLVADWFRARFDAPTEPQLRGWPHIAAGEHTLIAAPTGSGKTLAAFLACIDRLLTESLAGTLPADETRIVYVSPLRALSNDMHKNLEQPLAEITALAEAQATPSTQRPHVLTPIRVGLRTGDTTASQRATLVRRPPHILVTTPESLYLLVTSEKGRRALATTETVIVDEIHALVRDKRGSHLALTLERLKALCGRRLQRIGLSATQKPIESIARFLVGTEHEQRTEPTSNGMPALLRDAGMPFGVGSSCAIIDIGHDREPVSTGWWLDLAIETPASELGAVCTHEQWEEVHERLVELIEEHRSTLVFVNTRRMAERITHQLTERLGEGVVGSHHGSLSAKTRLETERRLKAGELKAVVATASLELGIDIGYVDLVSQIGSPRGIATFLQRIGRSGHSLGLVPKGRLFALTRDELLEAMALVRAVRAGRLDAIPIPEAPLDILAQQIVAEVAGREWPTDELYALCRRAWPYRNLSREDFDRTLEYLSEGIARNGRRGRRYLHRDLVTRRVRARRGARIAAAVNAGAIPEIASYRVVAEPERTVVGTLDEDFAVESLRGDVFLLGNTSWRILHVRGGEVTVADAQGAPPTIPFWRGEAPGRTFELSEEVSRLREELSEAVAVGSRQKAVGSGGNAASESVSPAHPAIQQLARETRCARSAAEQALRYVDAQQGAIGLVPTQKRVVFERFFDETGGMQLVVHAPFGAAITKAWGLALRKRFCRSFDFELQATADDDGFILSLGPQHSFPIESLFPMLTPRNARGLLEQAVLAVPTFQTRWHWNVMRALQVLRREGGKKVPPALGRFRADDLLTAVFPRLTGCQEEHTGDIPIPDHPLVNQTMDDCLHEALDVDGLLHVLGDIEAGRIELVARDTREPSPFCYELLNANVYAFLDGGEIQERRARAVATRRSVTVEDVRDLGRLDPEAIAQVRQEAQPLVRSADELHDLLLGRIVLPCGAVGSRQRAEGSDEDSGFGVQDSERQSDIATVTPPDWEPWYAELEVAGRAATVTLPDGRCAWVAAERLPAVCALFPETTPAPPLSVPQGVRTEWTSAEARVALVQGLIETCGPITADELAGRLAISPSQANAALEALEGEGVVLRGRFTLANSEFRSRKSDLPSGDDRSSTTDFRRPTSDLAIEWCHRRLLARIHRLTMQGLREQIQPVPVDVFQRFLFRHHGISSESTQREQVPHGSRSGGAHRRAGPNGLFEVIQLLEGLDIPAIGWERDVLPARLAEYRSAWLDELCLSGEVGWRRLFPPPRDPERSRPMASLTRVAPVSLFLRSDAAWLAAAAPAVDETQLSSPAQGVLELLRGRGAMFATDLANECRMLPAQLEEALGELVTCGLVTADGFGGLRNLIAAKGERSSNRRRPGRVRGMVRRRDPSAGSGRWSATSTQRDQEIETVEHWAWLLLRRWGVVFRDLLARESGAPAWFELARVYRRLEARGEIRGGRFVSGVGGEQFALGETVQRLRRLRDEPPEAEPLILSAADPLNLTGILTDGPRVPATASNRIAWLAGRPIAAWQGGDSVALAPLSEEQWRTVSARLRPAGRADSRRMESRAPREGESRSDSDTAADETKPPHRPRGIPRPRIS